MDIEIADRLNQIETTVNYLDYTGERPVNYLYEPPAGVPARSGRNVKHTMRIYDGRRVSDRLTLDREGFALVRHESRVINFYGADEVRLIYYPEVERLVKQALGATRVVVFDHNVRCRPMAKAGENGAREPVKFAHNDYTVKSGPQRVRDLLPDEADELLKHRFVEINVWRPIRGPVEESPLAVCDAESMTIRDFIASDLRYRDRILESTTRPARPTLLRARVSSPARSPSLRRSSARYAAAIFIRRRRASRESACASRIGLRLTHAPRGCGARSCRRFRALPPLPPRGHGS